MLERTDQQLGNYRIIKLLGSGGFADVYLGEHIYLRTQAAIKVLHTRLTQQEMESFIEEARTIARLQHPHIVQVLEFGIDERLPFLVMTFAPNGTMRTRYPRGTHLPLATIVDYVKQIVSALQYVHDQKLIYRDLKPENMLLGRSSEILLSDFGIALVAQTSYNPSVKAAAGTIAYMPPEQLQGKPRFASDQYALGVVVYEWLCGERPFSGTFSEMASQHMFMPPAPLREKLPLLIPEVEQVVMTALAKDPLQRFASVRVFAKALEQAAGLAKEGQATIPGTDDTLPISSLPSRLAHPPSAVQETISPAGTSPVSTPGLVAPTVSSGNAHPITPIPDAVVVPPVASQTSPVPDDFAMETFSDSFRPSTRITAESHVSQGEPAVAPEVSPHSMPSASPLQHNVSRRTVLSIIGSLVVVGGTATLVTWFTRQHNQNNPPLIQRSLPIGYLYTTYKGHVLSVFDVKWSPDGSLVASASNDSTVHIWDPSNGQKRVIYSGHTASANAVTWSPDSKLVASAGSDLKVQVWEVSSGSTLRTYHGHTRNIRTVSWSPEGQRIASAGDDGKVHVWEAATTKRMYVYPGHVGRVWSVAWSPNGQYIASGGDDKMIRIWNASSGKLLLAYGAHKDQVKSLDWSRDGQHIVSGSDDRTVQVWNAMTARTEFIYSKHVDVLNGVAWSPDGRRVASGSGDYTAHIWDAFSGKNSYIYRGHLLAVHAVTWVPNGARIASASDDHTVQVWKSI
jgi:eukaryotic-like serine/threonine-protein kinase